MVVAPTHIRDCVRLPKNIRAIIKLIVFNTTTSISEWRFDCPNIAPPLLFAAAIVIILLRFRIADCYIKSNVSFATDINKF